VCPTHQPAPCNEACFARSLSVAAPVLTDSNLRVNNVNMSRGWAMFLFSFPGSDSVKEQHSGSTNRLSWRERLLTHAICALRSMNKHDFGCRDKVSTVVTIAVPIQLMLRRQSRWCCCDQSFQISSRNANLKQDRNCLLCPRPRHHGKSDAPLRLLRFIQLVYLVQCT
jgi:hypothetical protein